MSAQCDLIYGSLRIAPSEFPAAEYDPPQTGQQLAILGGGCFWCTEAVFEALAGVTAVTSGYAGGTADTADYRSVCTGRTAHAEVIRIAYDAEVISYGQLLKVFFSVAHDPTQLNRQGGDSGPQYRSAIFYADEQQQDLAQRYIQQLEQAAVYEAPIVTRLEALEQFYEAEEYHQNYAAANPNQPYIAAVSTPKVEKLRAAFPEQLKTA